MLSFWLGESFWTSIKTPIITVWIKGKDNSFCCHCCWNRIILGYNSCLFCIFKLHKRREDRHWKVRDKWNECMKMHKWMNEILRSLLTETLNKWIDTSHPLSASVVLTAHNLYLFYFHIQEKNSYKTGTIYLLWRQQKYLKNIHDQDYNCTKVHLTIISIVLLLP